jgi:hypothetical protein
MDFFTTQNYENRKFTEFDYNKRKVSVEINIDNADGISASAIFKTPYTEDIGFLPLYVTSPLELKFKSSPLCSAVSAMSSVYGVLNIALALIPSALWLNLIQQTE